MSAPKIFIYPTMLYNSGDIVAIALAEDGVCLASHFSSSKAWSQHDMGYRDSEWKHELYKKHYPDGYELEWVDFDDVEGHEGLLAAYEKNQMLAKGATS